MGEPTGILIVNKPTGITSHDVVGRIRRLYGTRRVGHTGTLDPLASGVLVILIGRAAKAAEYLVAESKGYRATLRLGLETDTEDVTGSVLATSEALPSRETVLSVCEKFTGELLQVPPMYSALKQNGQKLCDLARRGVVVDRPARPIVIHRLDCFATDSPSDYLLDVECSSGTYIRTLCADIGKALGVGGVMATLERVRTGNFLLSDSVTVEELEAMSPEARLSLLIPTERLFDSLPSVALPAFFERLCRSGCEIYQKKLRTHHEVGQRLRLCTDDGRFFALGEVREFPDGSAIKALKLFDLE